MLVKKGKTKFFTTKQNNLRMLSSQESNAPTFFKRMAFLKMSGETLKKQCGESIPLLRLRLRPFRTFVEHPKWGRHQTAS